MDAALAVALKLFGSYDFVRYLKKSRYNNTSGNNVVFGA